MVQIIIVITYVEVLGDALVGEPSLRRYFVNCYSLVLQGFITGFEDFVGEEIPGFGKPCSSAEEVTALVDSVSEKLRTKKIPFQITGQHIKV